MFYKTGAKVGYISKRLRQYDNKVKKRMIFKEWGRGGSGMANKIDETERQMPEIR